MLLGRRRERAALDRLVLETRSGRGGALVLRGEAGVGKTALLEYLVDRALDAGSRVARATGVESEMELAFAGLHQLCAPLLDRLERLPGPQREALCVAFGMRDGLAPERFFVGLATLGLLAEAAREQPLVCVVDDAQWLDGASAQVLAFVARRLLAESVALVFAARDPCQQPEPGRLPELQVEGLDDADARALLATAVHGPLDEQVRDRIVAETRGNPLALLELPRGMTPAELAGGFALPDATPLANRLETSFTRRLGQLPGDSWWLLLVAAAEPLGDPLLVSSAADRLGIALDAAAPAVAAGLAAFGTRVQFRHPLVRSAIYHAASPQERQSVHRVLAEVTDPELDPDRRAWHRAHATARPDEDVASELERSAGRAQARGGIAAAAAFLERAAALTREPVLRANRALAAAQAKNDAGAFDAALDLLTTAQAGPLDELQRARADLLHAQIALNSGSGTEAAPLLLNAARRLEPLDVTLARETYLDALAAASFAGHLDGPTGLSEAAAAARAAPPARQGRAADLLLDGLSLLHSESYAAGAPTLKRALKAFRSEDISQEEEMRWLWVAVRTALRLWDDDALDVLSARQVELTRDTGALAMLPSALNSRVLVHLLAGELQAAASVIEEFEAITDAIGSRLPPYGALALATGRALSSIREAVSRGDRLALVVSEHARAVIYNGLGRYEDAIAPAQRAGEGREIGVDPWSLGELVEAAARSGNVELGAEALHRLAATTQASGTDWALGIEARSRALLSDDPGAERLYRVALDRLSRTRVRVEVARTHLLYGEWLRRERRQREAREELRTAHEMLTAMGLDAFARRADRELHATGESARKRTVETRHDLTPQEALVAQLARDGLSNADIGARLFISPRTVEYHLRKVFTKLDINSRRELDHALPERPYPVRAA